MPWIQAGGQRLFYESPHALGGATHDSLTRFLTIVPDLAGAGG